MRGSDSAIPLTSDPGSAYARGKRLSRWLLIADRSVGHSAHRSGHTAADRWRHFHWPLPVNFRGQRFVAQSPGAHPRRAAIMSRSIRSLAPASPVYYTRSRAPVMFQFQIFSPVSFSVSFNE